MARDIPTEAEVLDWYTTLSNWGAGATTMSGRWEFLATIAPLKLAGGTGSPVNPLALL